MWSSRHRPTKISGDWNVNVLLVVGFSARFRTGELGTFLFHTNPEPRVKCAGLQYARQRVGLLCASWRDLSSKAVAVDLSGSAGLAMPRFSKEKKQRRCR
jgi:hypothetical protein